MARHAGGWVFERAFLAFRSSVPKEVPPGKVDDYYEKQIGKLVEALEDVMNPSVEEHLCFDFAMQAFVDYERWGFPEAGGHNDQDALTMLAIECVRTARDKAEQLERQEEAHQGYLEAQRREEEAEVSDAPDS